MHTFPIKGAHKTTPLLKIYINQLAPLATVYLLHNTELHHLVEVSAGHRTYGLQLWDSVSWFFWQENRCFVFKEDINWLLFLRQFKVK